MARWAGLGLLAALVLLAQHLTFAAPGARLWQRGSRPLRLQMAQGPAVKELAEARKSDFIKEVAKAKPSGERAAMPQEANKVDDAEASSLPKWAPFAAFGGAALLAAVVAVGSAFLPSAQTQPAKRAAVPTVVQVQPPAPVPPTTPAAPAPRAAAPVVPQAAPATPVQPAAGRFGWARTLAAGIAEALRSVANGLPQAELALEAQVPAIEAGAEWVSGVRPENAQQKVQEALPVIGKTVAQGAETATRAGLRLTATGLHAASEELPSFGKALKGAVTEGMPGFQSGVHGVASLSRDLALKATELSKPGALPSSVPAVAQQALGLVPGVLDITAGGLDLLADNAPAIEQGIEYVAGKAEPILEAVLGSSSEVVSDASAAQIPEVDAREVANSLRAFGVDPDRLSTEAQAMVRDALFKASGKTAAVGQAAVVQAAVSE